MITESWYKPEAAPTQRHVQHVRELQDDIGILLRHLATTAAAGLVLPVGTTQPLGGEETAGAAALLALDPSDIARDKLLLQLLYAALARLSRLSAPADVNSIRLTQAFVHGWNAGAVPTAIDKAARRLRRWAWASAGFGLLVFAMAVTSFHSREKTAPSNPGIKHLEGGLQPLGP